MAPTATVSAPSEVIATNSITLTNLVEEAFLKENLDELRAQLESHGKLYKFVPAKSINRIFVVYYNTLDAKTAKTYCNRNIFLGKPIRIYFGQHTTIYDDSNNSRHLSVPQIDRNYLISPPCSPPVGWAPIRETGPNTTTLADDLSHAFARLSPNSLIPRVIEDEELTNFSLDDNGNSSEAQSENGLVNNDRKTLDKTQVPGLTIVFSDDNSDSEATTPKSDKPVPSILIQDWDTPFSVPTIQLPDRSTELHQSKASIPPALVNQFAMLTSRPRIIQTARPPVY